MATLPQINCPVELLAKEFENSKYRAYDLMRQSTQQADQTVAKINEIEPKDIADVDLSKIQPISADIKKKIETFFENYKKTVERYRQMFEFNCDLKGINDQIDELQLQLNALRGNYGESLPAARAISNAFQQFEKTIQLLEQKMRTFISNSDKMMKR